MKKIVMLLLLMTAFAINLLAAITQCSPYKGQVTINELRIGSSKNSSKSNQIELYNLTNIPQTVWRNWKLIVYSNRSGNTPTLRGTYSLSSGFTSNGQFIYNNNKSIYLRNRNTRYIDVALVDANGALIDYIAIENTIQSIPACFGTPTIINATSGSDTKGDIARLPDGGTWPANVTNTSSHTIGFTNVCTPGSDLVVSNSVDISNPIVNTTAITYTVDVLNKSCSNSISNIILSDIGISTTNFSALSYTRTQGSTTQGASTLTWNIGTLARGANATLTITGTPKVLGTLNTTASITSPTTGLINTADDSDTETIVVRDYNYIQFENVSATLREGTDTTYSALITANTIPSNTVTINYSVSGTGTSSDTNLPVSGSVVINPNDQESPDQININFTVTDDAISEPTKTINLTITNISSGDTSVRLNTSAKDMNITLLDDDNPLIADYHFDECVWNGTIEEVIDSSGNNYHATPKSANGSAIPQVSAQIINNGALFSRASQQYVELPTLAQSAPNFNDGFTVTAWAKFSGSAGSWERIFDIGNGTNINNIFLGRQGITNNLVLGIHDPGTSQYLVVNGAISDTNWHFWGATCNGSGGCKLFKDGVKIADSATMKIPANVARTKNYIGKSNWSADAYLEGGVDEFKFFDTTLSDSDIFTIYTNESADKNYDGTTRELPCCCVPTGGNLIANPSFETLCGTSIIQTWNGVEGGTVNMRNNVCGWTMNGSGMETWENTTNKPASDGSVFVEIDGYNTTVDQLSQTLNALNGIHYVISFDYKARDGGSDRIIAKWNGTEIGTFTGITTGWQTAQVEVVGTGSDILAFEEPSADNNALGSWIDNIRVAEGTLTTNCSDFSYDLYHHQDVVLTPSNRLHTRVVNSPFDVNVTVACSGTGDIPSRKIQKIYAITGVCPTSTIGLPILWNGSNDINNTNQTITISNLISTKAYSDIKLMLETNASELNCSSDTMAIKPTAFTLSSSSVKAGETLNATAINGGNGYNGTASVTSILSTADTDCTIQNTFLTPSAITFVNDANLSTLKTTDIGDINVTIADKTWTVIDNPNDCIVNSNITSWSGLSGKVGCDINTTVPLTINPYELNTTLTNFTTSGTPNWLYLDSSRTQQIEINTTIEAFGKDGIKTKNFSDGCTGSTVPLGVYFTQLTTPIDDMNISLNASTGSTSTIPNSNTKYSTAFNQPLFSIPNSSFKNGDSNLSLRFNFIRPSTPLNPFDLNLTAIKTNYGSNVIDNNATNLDKNATFVYGRIRGYDITTNQQYSINPIEIEVYGKNATGTFLNDKPQNVLNWYRNTDHDDALTGSVLSGNAYDASIAISNTTPPSNGIQSLGITYSQTSPITKKIHLDIPTWLWYSSSGKTYVSTGTDCSLHPCFTYNYTDTTAGVQGVNSGTFQGSDFQMTPAKNITNKGVKLFR